MKQYFSITAALSVALLGFSFPAGASLVGGMMNVTVTDGSVFGPDTVTVVVPDLEIVKGDGSDIGGTYFTRTASLAVVFDIFESASIDIQDRDIFISIDLADEFSLYGNINILGGVLFEFDLVEFSGGRGIGSVELSSTDPYFVTGPPPCSISGCIEFSLNTIRFELWTPNLDAFQYQINVQPVPEPGSLLLLAGGFAGLALLRRRKC